MEGDSNAAGSGATKGRNKKDKSAMGQTSEAALTIGQFNPSANVFSQLSAMYLQKKQSSQQPDSSEQEGGGGAAAAAGEDE